MEKKRNTKIADNSHAGGICSSLLVRSTAKAVIAIAFFVAISMVPIDASADRIVQNFASDRILDDGGCFEKNFTRGIGTGWVSANVQLRGWDMQFQDNKTHPIIRNRLVVYNINYNQNTGQLAFTTSGCLQGGGPFWYQLWFTILGQK